MSNTKNGTNDEQNSASIEAKIELVLLQEFEKTTDPDFKDKSTTKNTRLKEGSTLEDDPVFIICTPKSTGEETKITLHELFGQKSRYGPNFKKFIDKYEQKIRAHISDYDEQGEKMRGITIKTNDSAINL